MLHPISDNLLTSVLPCGYCFGKTIDKEVIYEQQQEKKQIILLMNNGKLIDYIIREKRLRIVEQKMTILFCSFSLQMRKLKPKQNQRTQTKIPGV